MFLLSRRQARAALAASAGAAVYLAASEIGARKLKMSGLFVVASAAMAGLVTAKASAKAYSVESRLKAHVIATAPAVNLVANGGTIGGSTTVSGNLTATTVNDQSSSRTNLSFSADPHQSAAPGSYSTSYEQATTNRLNTLIDAMQAVSDRADYIYNELADGGIAVH